MASIEARRQRKSSWDGGKDSPPKVEAKGPAEGEATKVLKEKRRPCEDAPGL